MWDLALLGFCWLPFYLWFVFGLDLERAWAGVRGSGYQVALAQAMFVALAITYVHRHYTFILVYGDRETFARHARGFILAPALVFFAVGALRFAHVSIDMSWKIAGIRVRPWLIALTVAGVWNIWHTVMQRYGITRIYAGMARGGLQERAHGRRDLALLWSCVALTAVGVLVARREALAGVGSGRRLLRVLGRVLDSPLSQGLLAAVAVAAAAAILWWARHELAARLTWRQRAPRLLFIASTMCLLLVFVVHGPIIGYLCFGIAHALEYVAFVHHFGQRKFAASETRAGAGATGTRSVAAALLQRPFLYAPILSGGLLLLFWALDDYRRADAYVVYYIGTSMLHFLFDGWIWKVRRPEVARPLGVTTGP